MEYRTCCPWHDSIWVYSNIVLGWASGPSSDGYGSLWICLVHWGKHRTHCHWLGIGQGRYGCLEMVLSLSLWISFGLVVNGNGSLVIIPGLTIHGSRVYTWFTGGSKWLTFDDHKTYTLWIWLFVDDYKTYCLWVWPTVNDHKIALYEYGSLWMTTRLTVSEYGPQWMIIQLLSMSLAHCGWLQDLLPMSLAHSEWS